MILLCLSLLAAWALPAATLNGLLVFGADDTPVPGYPVTLRVSSQTLDGITDENGMFTFTFDLSATSDSAYVSAFDLCNGVPASVTFALNPSQSNYQVVLRICDLINPPPPPTTCEAHFFAGQLFSSSDLEVAFFDLSFAATPIDSWAWDFGDGATSSASQPTHVYAQAGIYIASLTITVDTCVSTFSTTIIVLDATECNCPDDYYDPVCVATPSGGFISFDNPCLAQCAGYEPWIYFTCDSTQFCQAHFGYVAQDGSPLTLTFQDDSYAGLFGIESWQWTFGDGATATEANPTHTYAQAGIYQVGLTVVTADGCTSTFVTYVPVYDGDCPCPDVWDPVCVALPNGEIYTFDNDCEAGCFGYTAADFIECGCNCPEYYQPVCVISAAGDTLQFDNPCFAECQGYDPTTWFLCNPFNDCQVYHPVCVNCDGATIVFPNVCVAAEHGYGPEDFTLCDTDPGCICPDIWDPVCILTATGQTIQFGNACEAECAGFGPDDLVACDTTGVGCPCPAIWAPVCVLTADGQTIQFGNACEAGCAGFGPDQLVACDSTGVGCNCPTIWDPVCVVIVDGLTFQFSNACEAECAGFGPDQLVACDSTGVDCPCPTIWDPVCVLTATGQTIQFGNACEAECAGFSPDDLVACDSTGVGCPCPAIWDPVCVLTATGQTIQFGNACEAECAGFGPDQLVVCDSTGVGCNCPEYFDPVCALTVTGELQQFDNICFAWCAGIDPAQLVDCGPTGHNACEGCNCPQEIYEPVCVPTVAGPIVFPNPCVAECHGYGPDDWAHCGFDETCQANFEARPSPASPLTYLFSDLSVSPSAIQEWRWDFGDGALSFELAPTHTFPQAGVYWVSLTILSDSCQASTTQLVVVGDDGDITPPSCQAMFFFVQDPALPQSFAFVNMSMGAGTQMWWDFGDGATSTEANPSHTYAQPGVYLVTLTISGNGCVSSATMLLTTGDGIWYDGNCRALFLPIFGPDSLGVLFLNLSSNDAVDYMWDFGDGVTSTEAYPYHVYAEAGTYTIRLTITTADGCQQTYTVTMDLGGQNFTGAPAFSLVNNTAEPTPAVGFEARVYPNPAADQTWLEFQLEAGQDFEIQLLSGTGQQLSRWRSQATGGLQREEINLASLPAGLYVLRVHTTSGATATLRVVKQQ